MIPERPEWWMVSAAFALGLLVGGYSTRRLVLAALEDYRRTLFREKAG